MHGAARLDLAFKALADPVRRQMIRQLVAGEASVSQLAEPLPISLPAVLQHLRLLEESGLVTTRKAGRVRTCRIDGDALGQASAWIDGQRALWDARLDRLQDHVRQMKEEKNGSA